MSLKSKSKLISLFMAIDGNKRTKRKRPEEVGDECKSDGEDNEGLRDADSEEESGGKNGVHDEDEDHDLDDETEAQRHSRLLSKISQLSSSSKKKKKQATRSEASRVVSEFNLNSSKTRVKLSDLLDSIKDSTGLLKKQIKQREKKKLLQVPLTKPEADQITRKVNYGLVSKEISKWDSVVESNRNAEQLQFPLNQPSLRLQSSNEVVKRFEPSNELEQQVEQLLRSSENAVIEDRVLTEAEEKYLKAMSLEEAKARHRELQRMRALLSFEEAKLKRQKKIKSKRFHRLLKKDRMKKEMKEFEDIKEKQPEIALQKLEELDKLRALERASLRHKSTGKWAKHAKLRVKYDEKARESMMEQVETSRQLTRKRVVYSDDEEATAAAVDAVSAATGRSNRAASFAATTTIEAVEMEEEGEEVPNAPIDYNPWMRNGTLEQNKANEEPREQEMRQSTLVSQFKANKSDSEDSDDEREEGQRQLIAEAFAEDDVVNDFEAEKSKAVDKEKDKDINLYLPGWGSWGGHAINENEAKKSLFTIKALEVKRKDRNLGNVIISEKKSDTIAKYMVKQLPFPFKNVEEYEKSMRHPIGSTWNSEVAFRSATEPRVLTKMGKVIEPMDDSVLIQNKAVRKKQRMAKKRTKGRQTETQAEAE